jgi:uncharacterized protein (DUF433 family)
MVTETVVHSDPDILSGTPVFVGTRVPVQALLDHIEDGSTLDSSLDGYPSVTRAQAVGFLEQAAHALFSELRPAA